MTPVGLCFGLLYILFQKQVNFLFDFYSNFGFFFNLHPKNKNNNPMVKTEQKTLIWFTLIWLVLVSWLLIAKKNGDANEKCGWRFKWEFLPSNNWARLSNQNHVSYIQFLCSTDSNGRGLTLTIQPSQKVWFKEIILNFLNFSA